MSKMGEIRQAIKRFGGQKFTTTDIRKAVDMYNKTNQRLADLEKLGEIVRLDIVKTGGREMREWREVNINDQFVSEPVKRAKEPKDTESPWAKVYPEYFQLPNLQ